MCSTIERKEGYAPRLRAAFDFEAKFARDDPPGTFSGYGSVFDNTDGHGDVVLAGAFKESLAAWARKGKLPKMLWQHGQAGDTAATMPVGVWDEMREDATGLFVKGRLIALDTDRGRILHEGLKSGAIDALSMTYVATDVVYGSKSEEPFRTIKKADLYEVGPVLFGANELALVDETKAAGQIRTIRDFERFLRDAGFSKASATAIASRGFKAADLRDEGNPADDLAGLRERAARLFTSS
jgi:HK97 family phage prohead protease